MNNQPEVDSWKPPFSYDIGGDGKAYDVAVLANPDHSQGEWVKLADYRELERQRDAYAEMLRELANEPVIWLSALIRLRHPELGNATTQARQ